MRRPIGRYHVIIFSVNFDALPTLESQTPFKAIVYGEKLKKNLRAQIYLKIPDRIGNKYPLEMEARIIILLQISSLCTRPSIQFLRLLHLYNMITRLYFS